MIRKVELLAPAKNLQCGIAAIDHGADAVYIGADNFGARVAAGNSIDNIGQLCRYAHQYNAKVYVTINTIIFDSEIGQVENLIRKLEEINVDAILVQDMAILKICNNIKARSYCMPVHRQITGMRKGEMAEEFRLQKSCPCERAFFEGNK